MSYHRFQIFEKIGTEESQIVTSIELSEIVNLLIKQNTYFLSNSPNDFIFSCTNISLALLYFGIPNNLRRLILYAILNFLIAVSVPSYHIVEQKDLNKVNFTSGERLANYLDKILMYA